MKLQNQQQQQQLLQKQQELQPDQKSCSRVKEQERIAMPLTQLLTKPPLQQPRSKIPRLKSESKSSLLEEARQSLLDDPQAQRLILEQSQSMITLLQQTQSPQSEQSNTPYSYLDLPGLELSQLEISELEELQLQIKQNNENLLYSSLDPEHTPTADPTEDDISRCDVENEEGMDDLEALEKQINTFLARERMDNVSNLETFKLVVKLMENRMTYLMEEVIYLRNALDSKYSIIDQLLQIVTTKHLLFWLFKHYSNNIIALYCSTAVKTICSASK